MSWDVVKLKELLLIKNGKDHKTLEDGDIPVYGTGGIMRCASKFLYDGESILLPRKGTLSNIQYVKGKFWTVDTIYYTEINQKIVSAYFLFRYLRNLDLSGLDTGSTIPSMTFSKYYGIDIPLPPMETQNKIANILSAYDNLIENNQKQIKLLEEAAQRLYKEWFVDLRFPGYENTPVVDGVPEGWEEKLLGNILDKVKRTKQINTTDYLENGVIPIVDQSRDFIAGFTNDVETLVDVDCPIIVFGDHTRVLKYIQFPFAKGADGTQLIISTCENMPQPLLYCALISIDLSNYHYARHFKYLKAEKILIPTQEVAKTFDNLVAPLLKKMQILRDSSMKLTQARDRLLPKLMSGELEV